MSDRQGVNRTVSFLKKLPKIKGSGRIRYVFRGYDSVRREYKNFFIELYILSGGSNCSKIVYACEGNDALSASGEEACSLLTQPAAEGNGIKYAPSYVLMRGGYYGNGGRRTYAVFPRSVLRWSSKKRCLKLGSDQPADSWCTISAEGFSGSMILPERSVIPYTLDEVCGGSMYWKLRWRLRDQPVLSARMGSMEWNPWGIALDIEGTVTYGGITYTVGPESGKGYADRLCGLGNIAPSFHLSGSGIISQITGNSFGDACFAMYGIPDKDSAFYLHLGEYEVFLKKNVFYRKKSVLFNFMPGDTRLHWTVSVRIGRFIVDVDIYAEPSVMNVFNYESLSSSRLLQLLAGAEGSGEIRLYKVHRKNIELLEHVNIRNVLCEFGIEDRG